MNAYLTHLFQEGDPDKLISYMDGLNPDRFSLITFVDDLVPALVMESNLNFGSFHLIKMSLFLRNLSNRGVFSAETEKALAKLILQHLFYLEWIRVSADSLPHALEPIEHLLEEMLSEIADGNAHNAYLYAAKASMVDKGGLSNALLLNGSLSIPDTLGHSISCFYPVIDDVIAVDHPASGTSLLSLIMYLCRFRKQSHPVSAKNSPITPSEKSRLLATAASGTGIYDIHHMITFYTCQAWENASWNKGTIPPWTSLTGWIGEKPIDMKRQTRVAEARPVTIPESYEHWLELFRSKNRDAIVDSAIAIVTESREKAYDWLFRVYTEFYTPDWDPHYYTSLYAALELGCDLSIAPQDSTMALIQALEYFLEGIAP